MAGTERHTVVETAQFIREAGRLMSDAERAALIDHLSLHPTAGVAIQGTGGARKLRWAVGGGGKSGGVRVITFYSGASIPVFLMDVFGKSEKVNLTKAERNDLKAELAAFVETYLDRKERR